MTFGIRKEKKDLTPPDPKPILTVLLIVLCAFPFCLTTGKIDWVEHVAFTPQKFGEYLALQNWNSMAQLLAQATTAQLSPLVWICNALSMWVFGYLLEKKLKGWRYPLYIVLCTVAAWTAVYATAGFNVSKMYVGPSMLFFAMLGGYFVFFPKKPFQPQQWLRPSTEIFRNDKQPMPHERYWVSPWLYVSFFVVYQIALQIFLNFGKEWVIEKTHMEVLGNLHQWMVGRMQVQPSAFSPIAAAISVGIGAILAQMLPAIGLVLKPRRPGGKLQLEVIQHYRELRSLDMTHDQACEGAAKFTAVPIDIAKDWISKGAAGLKDQEIK